MFHYFLICILYLLNWTLNDDGIHVPFQFLLFIYPCMSARTSFTFFSIVLALKREKVFFFILSTSRYGYKPSKRVVGGSKGNFSRTILHHFPTIVVRSLVVLFYGRSFQLFPIISRSLSLRLSSLFDLLTFCCQRFHMVEKLWGFTRVDFSTKILNKENFFF